MDGVPQRLGRYPVERELGRGGMGVVYRALDPRLDRRVAIKVLSPALAADPDAWARLEREARLLAALNHPHVAAIYGLEETDQGERFLVLEWVDGESLEDRLARGRLSLDEALRVGGEIAAGLDAAHRRGVIHRDLKPANVRLTTEGRAKLLDFGLARRTEGVGGAAEEEVGEVSGTPGYMSPEQVRSLPEDARSDAFAFGCVLYECLSGRMAFGGETLGDRVRALVACAPDWEALPAETPDAVRAVLRDCLAEDAARRAADLGAVRERLDRAAAQGRPDAEAGAAPAGNLPSSAASFVGRTAEIETLLAAVSDRAIVTLAGPGGAGKTRLALELARRARPSFPDGVWFVDLAPISDPALVPAAAAAALGVREEPGRSLLDSLVARLRAAAALLVLDNCEQVVAGAAALASATTSSCDRLRVVATSREPLGAGGEHVHRVGGLSLPVRDDAQTAAGAEAVRLFVERAAAARPGFALTAENASSVARVCRRLEGIPLALELAAARVRVLSVEQIDARLNDRFRLLAGGASGRHATLRSAMDWSHDLLSGEERRFLRRLSVFAGGWTLEAARTVAADGRDEFEVLDLLTHLADKSLVGVAAGPGGETRYSFSETVRQYARERLVEAGEADAAAAPHFAFFLALAERSMPHTAGGPEQRVWLERLDADHENLLAAISSGGEEDAPERLRLASALGKFWLARGYLGVGIDALRGAAAAAGDRADAWVRATALNGLGLLAERRGDYATAVTAYEQTMSAFRALGEERGVAGALSNLGVVAKNRGQFAKARALTEEALAINRRIGNREFEGRNLNNLGTIAAEQGDLDEALARYRESLIVRRDLGDAAGVALCLSNIGSVLYRNGDPAAAKELLLESLFGWRSLGVRWGEAMVLKNLGDLSESTGNDAEAAAHHRAALALRRDFDDRPGVASSLESTAGVLARAGALAAAVRCVGAAQRLREDLGAPLAPPDQREHDADVAALRARLRDDLWSVELSRGRAKPWKEACDDALAALDAVARAPVAPSAPRPDAR